ncbi:MAG: PilZ domain-containing protein [Bdellovibrionales bacterium]|nr:PilZ domain-containing protein [Bdellovibrionales bacterium]
MKGVKRRHATRTVRALSSLHLAFPFVYLLVSAVVFDVPAGRMAAFALTPLFLTLSVIMVIVGWGLREMKPWARHAALAGSAFVFYANAVLVLNYSASHYKPLAFLAGAAAAVAVAYQISRELRVPYLAPRIRWWESNPEFQLNLPARLVGDQSSGSAIWEGQVMDFSSRGCFLKLRDLPEEETSVDCVFQVDGSEYRVPGLVVWSTESGVTHPRGAGVRFDRTDRRQRRELRTLARRLAASGQLDGKRDDL